MSTPASSPTPLRGTSTAPPTQTPLSEKLPHRSPPPPQTSPLHTGSPTARTACTPVTQKRPDICHPPHPDPCHTKAAPHLPPPILTHHTEAAPQLHPPTNLSYTGDPTPPRLAAGHSPALGSLPSEHPVQAPGTRGCWGGGGGGSHSTCRRTEGQGK